MFDDWFRILLSFLPFVIIVLLFFVGLQGVEWVI